MYFVAGALLPTLAWALQNVNQRRKKKNNDNLTALGDFDSEEDEDDDDDDNNNNAATAAASNHSSPHTPACAHWTLADAPYKMVLVVNTDLPMGKGKIAAQCGHAAVGCFERAARTCPHAVRAWKRTGCAKIALKCSEDEMVLIAGKALSQDIPLYLVEDAGRTQIAAGSRTVLGLFGPTHVFIGLTDHLKLM